jgi:hypothetical protein
VGGLRLELYHPLHAGESVLVDVMLPTGHKLRTRCRLLTIEGTSPAKVVGRGQFENLRGEEHRHLVTFLESLDEQQESPVHT